MSSSVGAKFHHYRETSQPLTFLTAASFKESSDVQSIHHGDTATDAGHYVPKSIETLGASPSPGLRRLGRANPVPEAKCAKSPLTRRIGYYQVTNVRKRTCHRITPAEIAIDGLTHLFLSHAVIYQNNFEIAPSHPDDIQLYRDVKARKTPNMQTWISLEGYDSSPPGSPSHRSWSLMTATVDRRATFIKSAGEFLDVHGFQGIDLDWEYPAATNLGGSASDTANYVALVREMRKAWGNKYGISATLPPSTSYLNGIDAKGLEPYIDFFGYLSYDLRPRPGSELVVYPHTDIHDIEEATQALRAKGINLKKVNFGLSKYG
ncbi:MAG: hypothetical protein Q9180_009373, partial [Flavoplaca navasiana]